MRTNLKVLRVRLNLTQDEMADKIGCARATYAAIEAGKREGRKEFWISLQKTYNIPNEKMWELIID